MCYADGSIDQATSTCPMCKVFRPSAARCPHRTDTCRNKTLHPRHDVVHFKNAEVQTFNGCGFCKWAQTNPPPNKSGYSNPGWPGCCRPPSAQEYASIPPADWRAVSIVHRVPIPPDVQSLLDSLPVKTVTSQSVTPGVVRAQPTSPNDRRSIPAQARTGSITSTRTPPMAVPQKTRPGGSPRQVASSLTNAGSRTSGGYLATSPSPKATAMDLPTRRSGASDAHEKHTEGFRTTPPATFRKLAEGDNGTLRRSPDRRPSLSAALSPASPSGAGVLQGPPVLVRRVSAANSSPPQSQVTNRVTSTPKAPTKPQTKVETLEDATAALNLSSACSDSSSDSGSLSSRSSQQEGTITSDGGFTDYLSDESEAEIQRQAEVKAAILEHNRAEEQEFKAARQQLATVGLRPPTTWNPRNLSNQMASTAGAIRAGFAGDARSR